MFVTFYSIPTTIAEFSSLPQTDLSKPENTCAMLLLALELYTKNKDAGIEAVNLLRGPRPLSNYEIQFLRDRLRDKVYLPLAYFDGATPQNNYTPSTPLTLQVLPDPAPQYTEDGYLRVFLKTAGADSPRPVTLRRKGENWYLWEYSSILSGIRIPVKDDPWA